MPFSLIPTCEDKWGVFHETWPLTTCLWLSCSQQSFILGCRGSKERPKNQLQVMPTEKDILLTTCDKCCDSVNFWHWLSLLSWLLWNLWQLYHKKMWPSVSKGCGLGSFSIFCCLYLHQYCLGLLQCWFCSKKNTQDLPVAWNAIREII